MKTLLLRLVIPLTIISFAFISKWWYALPEDAPDTMYTGFPLVHTGAAWHTSLAYQIFITEFLIDILSYFLFWLLLTFCINRFLFKIKLPRLITSILWFVSILVIACWTCILSMGDNVYNIKRPYNMEVMETGYELFWQHTKRPHLYNDPKDK